MDRHNYSGRGYADDWNKTSYSEGGGSNHVHRPVIVDAEGRKKPFLPFVPNSETYFKVSAERTVEHVRAPVVVSEYKYSSEGIVEPYGYGKSFGEYGYGSPTKVEPLKSYGEYGYNPPTKVEPVKSYGEYGYISPPKRDPTRNYGALGSGPNDKWGGSTTPIRSHPPATEYGHGYPTSKEGYIKDSRAASDTGKWGPQVPTTDYGYGYPAPVKDSRVANDTRERPQPTRPNILGASAWPRPSGQGATTGYEDYNTSGDWNKPGGRSDYYQKNDKYSDPIAPLKESNRETPGQRLNYGTPLSGPTNDIEKAVEMLKEAVKSTAISYRHSHAVRLANLLHGPPYFVLHAFSVQHPSNRSFAVWERSNSDLNVGFLLTLIYAVFYVCLDVKAGSLAALLCFICWVVSSYLGGRMGFSLAWKVVLVAQVACWTGQFIGHGVFEKRAPALLDNLSQAFLMAPFFVLLEALQKVFAYEPYPGFHAAVQARIEAEINDWEDKKQKLIS